MFPVAQARRCLVVLRHATESSWRYAVLKFRLRHELVNPRRQQLTVRIVDGPAREKILLRSPEPLKMPTFAPGDSNHTHDMTSKLLVLLRRRCIIALHREGKSLLYVAPCTSGRMLQAKVLYPHIFGHSEDNDPSEGPIGRPIIPRATQVTAFVQSKPNGGMGIVKDIEPGSLEAIVLEYGAEVVPRESGARYYLP